MFSSDQLKHRRKKNLANSNSNSPTSQTFWKTNQYRMLEFWRGVVLAVCRNFRSNTERCGALQVSLDWPPAVSVDISAAIGSNGFRNSFETAPKDVRAQLELRSPYPVRPKPFKLIVKRTARYQAARLVSCSQNKKYHTIQQTAPPKLQSETDCK